jgi:hypothetical protein
MSAGVIVRDVGAAAAACFDVGAFTGAEADADAGARPAEDAHPASTHAALATPSTHPTTGLTP